MKNPRLNVQTIAIKESQEMGRENRIKRRGIKDFINVSTEVPKRSRQRYKKRGQSNSLKCVC